VGYEPLWDAEAAGPIEIGVDIIEIARIERVLDRFGERFLRRIYTERERARYHGRVPELAVRFAAKEATMKALGTGVRGIGWREIEILSNLRGKPVVILHGAARRRADQLGFRHLAVSLSHSRTVAIAVVVAAQEDRERSAGHAEAVPGR
jgi:holo-[acyl-carrier protein] synthase